MKIRTKFALVSILFTGTALIVCGILSLTATSNSYKQVAVDSAITDMNVLCTAYMDAANQQEYNGMSEIAKRSIMLYLFQQYTKTNQNKTDYILTHDNNVLHNSTNFDPSQYSSRMIESQATPIAQKFYYCFIEFSGTNYALISTSLMFNDDVYDLSLVRDIQNIYDEIRSLTLQYALICALSFAGISLVILIVTNKMLKPLEDLKENAERIADGDYGRKFIVSGNDEISSLANSFNDMSGAIQSRIEDLERTAEERKLLIGALTHELKTPMTSILANSEALQIAKLSEEQKIETASCICDEVKRLERLTQKMMGLIGALNRDDIALIDTPIKAVYDAVTRTLAQACQENNVVLALEYGNESHCMDIDLMSSVFVNLVDNAIKAGATKITVRSAGHAIEFIDNGRGIPNEELKYITQPFYMVDKSRSKKMGGIGLGLALVNRIAQIHNAALFIDSALQEGTTVYFVFDE